MTRPVLDGGSAEPVDALVSGPEPSRRRRALLVVVVVLALLCAAGAVAARWERQRQLDALVGAAAEAERVIAAQHTSLYGLYGYTAAELARTDTGAAQRAALLAVFSTDAGRFRPRMAAPRAQASSVHPLPWEGDLSRARAAVLARIDAWTAAIDASQADPDRLLSERRDTQAERVGAADALLAASDGHADAALAGVLTSLRGR